MGLLLCKFSLIPDEKILLHVAALDLGPDGVSCDKLDIYEGVMDDASSPIASFCGTDDPGRHELACKY